VSGSVICQRYWVRLLARTVVPTSFPFPVAVQVEGTVHHSSTVALSSGRSLHGHHVLAPTGSESVDTAVPGKPPLIFCHEIESSTDTGTPL